MTLFERLSLLSLQEGLQLFTATLALITFGFLIGGWWSRRKEAKKYQQPRIEMIIGAAPGGLHLGEWRHVVLTIFNRREANIRLVSVLRKSPNRLRLFKFVNHQTAPIGAPAKQIDVDKLIYGIGKGQPTHAGFEFLFKLSESPTEDSGVEIKCIFRFIDLDDGKKLSVQAKAMIP